MENSQADLTVAEIAMLVRLNPDTVGKAIRDGLLKGSRVGARKWLVTRDDYLDWRARGAPTVKAKTAEAAQ